VSDPGQPVLLADIGGTNARFALADTSDRMPLREDTVMEYAVADFPSLGDAARRYLDDGAAWAGGEPVRSGVFAVAGRVEEGHARITNHPWVISAPRIREMIDFSSLRLVNLQRALSEIAGIDPGPMKPADITAGARAGDPRCMRAVDVFCAAFGAIAGDLALTTGAWDGVFLTGGLVPRMLHALQHSGFRQRFEHKGRFSPNMARVPSMAVLHPHAGLLGCAVIARQSTATAMART
jgi:glucokinase